MILALAGGVGGARLAQGLVQVLAPDRLGIAVNVGDDFEHLGLHVSPDLDTVMYTLAGMHNAEAGWGRAHETWHFMEALERLGGETWFRLGDRDLGTHLMRTQQLADGATLTAVTANLCARLAVAARVLPMCDEPRPTLLATSEGTLDFQEWLVRRRAVPSVTRVWSEGTSKPTLEVIDAIQKADIIIIGPSNPYVSIDPILTLDGVREALFGKLVVAVSPIVFGNAVKGPLASMIEQLENRPASAAAIADHYRGMLRGIVTEHGDHRALGIPAFPTRTVMHSRSERAQLARDVLQFAKEIA